MNQEIHFSLHSWQERCDACKDIDSATQQLPKITPVCKHHHLRKDQKSYFTVLYQNGICRVNLEIYYYNYHTCRGSLQKKRFSTTRRVWLWTAFQKMQQGLATWEVWILRLAHLWKQSRDGLLVIAAARSQWPGSATQAKVLNSKLSCRRFKKNIYAKTSKGLTSLWVSAKSPKLWASSGLKDREGDLISSLHSKLLQIFSAFLPEAAACINCSHTKHRNTLVLSKHLVQQRYFYPVRTKGGEIIPSDRSRGMGVAFLVTCLMVPEACHGPANLNRQLN